MKPLHRFAQLSSAFRVPIMVMLLMATVSVVLSERVLTRLSQHQEAYLEGLANSYLDGVAASVSPSVLRRDNWEIYDALSRMKPQKDSILPRETVITDAHDIILASDRPETHPTLTQMGQTFRGNFDASQMRLDVGSKLAFQIRPISHNGETIGNVYVVFDASSLLKERHDVLLALLLTNALLTALLAGIGFFVVRRMVRPLQILESHLQISASGGLQPISNDEFRKAGREAKRMFAAFNGLVSAEKDKEALVDQLTKEERLASLGRIASGMAHEINNPLGGLLNAANTLQKHGHLKNVRLESVDLIRRGLLGIRDVVQAALVTYRPERSSRALALRDLSDVALLTRPELKNRSQHLTISSPQSVDVFTGLPAGPMRQAIMNLILNASNASPDDADIVLAISRTNDEFRVQVEDLGQGMPEVATHILTAPIKSGVPDGISGLGLWVVRQIADELGASLSVRSNVPRGTVIAMAIPHHQTEMFNAAA